ncbi:unnamed protein product [Clonostachys solani]|uniref:Uncharacterized protein n=1 Tax=Clonostachys solani TaxID=160281 RepID=A0A9N9ZMD2_9HYPO|nr:unnamed protein product [Clonostachys solani]
MAHSLYLVYLILSRVIDNVGSTRNILHKNSAPSVDPYLKLRRRAMGDLDDLCGRAPTGSSFLSRLTGSDRALPDKDHRRFDARLGPVGNPRNVA